MREDTNKLIKDASIHTYVHTYIHMCIHEYVHAYKKMCPEEQNKRRRRGENEWRLGREVERKSKGRKYITFSKL